MQPTNTAPQQLAPGTLVWDIEVLSWSGDDATVTWTDADGDHRAVVCVELEPPDLSVGYAGGVSYGGDDVPSAVEECLAEAAMDRALDRWRDGEEQRAEWRHATRRGEM